MNLKILQALLSGCSAGGLATLIHCDDFRELLPKDATVKCLADAGFFLDEYVFACKLLFVVPILLASMTCDLFDAWISFLYRCGLC